MLDAETRAYYRLGWAMVISLAVTAGFVLLFGGVGLVISAGGRALMDALPWLGLTVGALLMLLGFWLLTGKGQVYFGLAQRASVGINIQAGNRVLSFFLFGIAYGLASLGCALPLFLVVVVSSTTAGNFVNGLLQFVYYALGMGLVFMALTVGTALFKGAVAGYLRAALPYVERATALLVSLAGAFIIYYWIGIGGLGPDSWQIGWLNDAVLYGIGGVEREASEAVLLIPGYAFGLGMVATINPCGFALLPAYLSLYLIGGEVGVPVPGAASEAPGAGQR